MDANAIAVVRKIVTPDAFYRSGYRRVYEAIIELDAIGTAADILTVTRLLDQRGQLDAVGGHAGLGALIDAVPTAANVVYHARLVREIAHRRAIITEAERAAQGAREGREPAATVARALQAAVLPLAGDDAAARGFQRADPVGVLAEIEARGRVEGEGIRSGFAEIDRHTHGFRPGELVIIGAVPKAGKTALALEMARRNVFAGRGVAIVSAEMASAQVVERLLNAESGVLVSSTSSGRITAHEASALVDAAGRIAGAPLWIDDAATPTLDDVSARVTALKSEHPEVLIVVVDFLQLVQHRMKGRRGDEELAAISYGLKALAKRCACVVLAPCQLNYKDVEDRIGARPKLRDLSGGSGMLQAADFVAIAHRPAMYSPSAADVIELDFAACRRCAPFRIALDWDGARMRIKSQLAPYPNGEDIRYEPS
jgi:replicative DNA helicase